MGKLAERVEVTCGELLPLIDATGGMVQLPGWLSPWVARGLVAGALLRDMPRSEMLIVEDELSRWLAELQQEGRLTWG